MLANLTNLTNETIRASVDANSHELLLHGVKAADIASVLSLLLLIVGFFVTLKTLQESMRLNKLQTLPLIHFKYRAAGGGSLHIVNSGKSAAVGIKIEKLYNVTYAPNMLMKGITVTRFVHKNFLKAGAEEAVKLESNGPWAAWGEEIGLYTMFSDKKPIKYYVWYRDLSDRKYVMRVSVFNEDSDIAGVPKVYGLRQKIVVWSYMAKDKLTIFVRYVRVVLIPMAKEYFDKHLKFSTKVK